MRRAWALLVLLSGCGSGPTLPGPLESPAPSPTAPNGTTVLPADTCAPGAWCWMKGRPLTVGGDRTLRTTHAIGQEGEFLRWESGRWVSTPLPERVPLVSAWVGSASDAWASDTMGRAWRFDGRAWRDASATLPITELVGAPDGTLWAVAGGASGAHGGSSGAHLLQRSGEAWVEPAPPHTYCMGGAFLPLGGGEIWSAGLVCEDERVVAVEVRRFDGSAWQVVGARIERQGWFPRLERVGERVRVHATGWFEWDGASWQPVTPAEYPQGLSNDQRALGDGLGMTIVPASLRCEGMYRLDASSAWCFGDGQIHAQTADGWRPTLSHAFEATAPASAWGTLPPTVWAGGDARRAWGSGPTDVLRVRRSAGSRLEHYDGTRWTIVLDEEVIDLDGAGAGDAWVLTARGPLSGDGRTFEARPIPAGMTTEPVERVRALGAGRAAAMSGKEVLVFEDGAWSVRYREGAELPSGWYVGSVAGTGPDDLWVARYRIGRPFTYAIDHFDGRTWAEDPAALSEGAELTTVGGETWAYAHGAVGKLGAREAAVPLGWGTYDASLWVGADAIWVTTDWQAVRYGL